MSVTAYTLIIEGPAGLPAKVEAALDARVTVVEGE